MDPLHICGFTFAHVSFFLVVMGLIVPRSLDVFVKHERRGDSKVIYAPQELMPIFVARVEGLESVEDAVDSEETAPANGDKGVMQSQ